MGEVGRDFWRAQAERALRICNGTGAAVIRLSAASRGAPDMQWKRAPGVGDTRGGTGCLGKRKDRVGQATSKGVRDGGDAQSRSRALGIGTGRSGSKRGCIERTRGKLFEGPFQKGAKLLSVTTAQCDGRVVRERRWPSVIYCTGSPLPTNRRSV